ncbi:MAG: ABC transporter ATP-binding protein [Cytophagaceae bacterium]|nr:ABC transporter ATP-binding protein [Cytophagaceae bacterium]
MEVTSKLARYIKPYRGFFILEIALTILVALLATIKPFIIQHIIDNEIANKDLPGLYLIIALLMVILVAHVIVSYANTYLADWLGQSIIRDIRIKLYAHIMRFRLSFFDKTPIGRLVTRNISDIETLSNFTSEGLAGILGDLLQLSLIVGFMLYINWKLTLISLCVLPFLLISTYVFKESIKGSFNMVRVAVSNLNTFVQEHITGMAVVQIFNSEEREYKKFESINKEHRDANLKSVHYYSIYFPIAEIISAVSLGLLVWYGSKQVLSSEIELGVITSFIMYIYMFFRPIRMIADRFNTLQLAVISADRIFKLLEDDEEIAENGTVQKDIKGEVTFDHVSFGYEPDRFVLKDISFTVKQGQTYALVGPTGAGKSSVINLISRLYDIQKGSILIDGVNVRDYELSNLRAQIGTVLQDVFLFSDSIRNNITLHNPDMTDEQIWRAAELVGAAPFIRQLHGQLDYKVMERGGTLSVGQRQLISFIRTLVYDPKIIILDEATSSIDGETEELIQEAILKLMKGRTAIVIAHRLSTVQHADNILVIEKGEIKERGNHKELIKLGGIYAQMATVQFKVEV